MKAFSYKAALWCEVCARQAMLDQAMVAADFDHSNHNAADAMESVWAAHGFTSESDYDSDVFPKGPYGEGGGESDTPQHCDACGAFLENPLTPQGDSYVREAAAPYAMGDDGESWAMVADRAEQNGEPVVAEWVRFYFAPGM